MMSESRSYKKHFDNYFDKAKIDLDVKAVREQVDIVASTQVPTLLSSIIGKDYVEIRESTSAIVTVSDVVCVLVLDPSGDHSIEFLDNVQFNAPACSVQANSTNRLVLSSFASTPPKALSFCVADNSHGTFSPPVKTVCTPVADPYVHLTPPAGAPCAGINLLQGSNQSDPSQWMLSPTVASLTTNNAAAGTHILKPGTYCEGLTLDAANVKQCLELT